jgi:hypothetical protein
VIAADIGHDHFLVWRIDKSQAAALVSGLQPFVSEGSAWLLCAAAEFRVWRLLGFPGIGSLRTAAWLIPCVLADGRIGNAFVSRFVDHAWFPHGWTFVGWNHTNIRIAADRVTIGGQASAKAGGFADAHQLSWFDSDRCGLISKRGGWSRWPIVKQDWRWSFRMAHMHSPVAHEWGAQAVGMITVNRTLALWGRPIACDERG